MVCLTCTVKFLLGERWMNSYPFLTWPGRLARSCKGCSGRDARATAIVFYLPFVLGQTLLAQPAGLPAGGRGLEQPVYIADRSMDGANGAVSSLDFSRYLDNAIAVGNDAIVVENNAPRLDFKQFKAGDLVAVVGQEPLLLGDIMPPRKLTPQIIEHPEFESQLRRALAQAILRKALVQQFINQQVSGKSVKERQNAKQMIQKKVVEAFYTEAMPGMMKDFKCETEEDFYQQLEKQGTTVQGLQREWADNVLAQECLRSAVNVKPTVQLSELQDHYEDNLERFRQPAKVRFEILTAEFSKHPNRQAAYDAISDMGNQVFYGKPFETVAKESSNGWTASNGGKVDWTSQGALKSKPIDEAIFSLEMTPVNQLSKVIEDATGYHIVRVLERQHERIVPFAEMQNEIRGELEKEKKSKAEKEFLEKIKRETVIWSRWPEDFPNAMPLNQFYE